MLIETQKNRNTFEPHTPALPFRAAPITPREQARPWPRPDQGSAPSPSPVSRETEFDAAEAGLTLRWLRTSQSESPHLHSQSGPGRNHKWWYIAEAEPGSWLRLGLRHPASAEQIRSAALSGRLPEMLRRIEPAIGDMFLIEAGTLHAAGPGLTIVEVAEGNSTPLVLEPSSPAQLLSACEQAICDPQPITPLPGETIPFRIAHEMLAPEQRVMLMDPLACVAVVKGSGTFGNRPFEAGQCWQFNGPLATRAIEPTVLIVAERCEPAPGSDGIWRARQ